jgi:hypothetical protein
MKKVVFLFLGILFLSFGCTRDDICTPETSKTPELIIRFYSADNPLLLKSVTNLQIVSVIDGDTIALSTPQTIDSIAIPLDTRFDFTDYIFFKNATDSIPGADLVSFIYERDNEFINRACAFRTNFKNLDTNLGSPTQQSWIDEITIKTDSVNARNQNEAHLSIFH